jgi:hypothetical protein
MKNRVDVAIVRLFALFLTSPGLRDAIAMPSVWRRSGQPKMVAANRFRSDYPLYFAFVACCVLDTLERHPDLCVFVVDAELVAGFCVDPVVAFPHSGRVKNDRERHLGYDVPHEFVPVVHRCSQKSLDTVGLAARSLATTRRERCWCFRSSMEHMWSAVGCLGWLVNNRKHAGIWPLFAANNEPLPAPGTSQPQNASAIESIPARHSRN